MSFDQIRSPIAEVLVEIKDANTPDSLFVFELQGSHHEAIERAETAAVPETGMMESGAGRHCHPATGQRLTRGGKHGAIRVQRRLRDFHACVVKAIFELAAQHATHKTRVMGQTEIGLGYWRR
jgi:hypothetical protein